MRKAWILIFLLTGCAAVKPVKPEIFNALVQAHNELATKHNMVATCLYLSEDLAAYKKCIEGESRATK